MIVDIKKSLEFAELFIPQLHSIFFDTPEFLKRKSLETRSELFRSSILFFGTSCLVIATLVAVLVKKDESYFSTMVAFLTANIFYLVASIALIGECDRISGVSFQNDQRNLFNCFLIFLYGATIFWTGIAIVIHDSIMIANGTFLGKVPMFDFKAQAALMQQVNTKQHYIGFVVSGLMAGINIYIIILAFKSYNAARKYLSIPRRKRVISYLILFVATFTVFLPIVLVFSYLRDIAIYGQSTW